MPKSLPSDLVDKISSGQCVLFLGAGATRDAGGPTGPELATSLADYFRKPDIPTNDLRYFADVLTGLPDVDREAVDEKIVELLKKLAPSEGHRIIPSLAWKAIFTTNYDRLVEIAYDSLYASAGEYPTQEIKTVHAGELGSFVDPTQVCLYKLHGCISSITKQNPLVLTTRDYENTRKKRGRMLRFLRGLGSHHAILFVGYSFIDPIVPSLLNELEAESPYDSHRRMYVLTRAPSQSEVEYFNSRNITCIPSTFSEAFVQLNEYLNHEVKKRYLSGRISPIPSPVGDYVSLPAKLRISLEPQIEILSPSSIHPRNDARQFLRGLPPTAGDIKNRNDIHRLQEEELGKKVADLLDSNEYLRPIVPVLGPGGAGKSTLALRVAYNLAEQQRAVAVRMRSHELWKRDQVVEFARRINFPSIFVIDGIELHACFKAARELRNELSNARCRSLLLISCQKAVWNLEPADAGDDLSV